MSIILNIQFLQHRKHSVSIMKTNWKILFREMISVHSGSHTESTNMCGKADFVILMQVVCTVTIVFSSGIYKIPLC